jgi:hypothetical protein
MAQEFYQIDSPCAVSWTIPHGGGEPVPLRILYEDTALVFVGEPAGPVVQRWIFAPDERCLRDPVQQQTAPAFFLKRLDRGRAASSFSSSARTSRAG